MAYGNAHYLFQIFQHGTARVARIEMITTYLAGGLTQVLADGYTWWQMQAEDGTTGWAVNIPEWYAPVSEGETPTPGVKLTYQVGRGW